jgi:hypothetical protein
MSSYQLSVRLDKVACRHTESVSSSDKFALKGQVITDLGNSHFIMPMMRINDGEDREFPDDLAVVFSGFSGTSTIGVILEAWDIDENDSWVENREEIAKISEAVQGCSVLLKGGV